MDHALITVKWRQFAGSFFTVSQQRETQKLSVSIRFMRNKSHVHLSIFSATLHGKKEELYPVCEVAKAAYSPRNIFSEGEVREQLELKVQSNLHQRPPFYNGHVFWPTLHTMTLF